MRGSRKVLSMLAASVSLLGCKAQLTGEAQGTCTVRREGRAPGAPLPTSERTDPATLHISDGPDGSLQIRMNGCAFVARAAPALPNQNPHYLIQEGGSCEWDVDGTGARRFAVAHRPPSGEATEDTGEEAYVNFAGEEIFVAFTAPFPSGGVASFHCDAKRAR